LTMNVLTAQFEKDQRSLYEDKVLEYQTSITGEREKMEGEFRELKEQERQARLDYERDVRAKYEARQMESERVMAQAIKERDAEEAQLRQDMEQARLACATTLSSRASTRACEVRSSVRQTSCVQR